jgi:hypothetical protein
MSTAASTINPEAIRKELSELWVSLAKEKDGEAGVLRACSMTLIAVMDEKEDPSQTGETIAMLMREHPSRAIVVRVRDSQEHFLDSRVFAQCWMPFGDRRQICCEEVEITSSSASLPDVPAVILPLVVADLPVVLWCRCPNSLEALAGMAGKVILDSAALADFTQVAEMSKRFRLADLAWTRATRWRELIAQIFENRCHLEKLPSLKRARVVYTREAPSVSAFYLAAWLEREETVWERGTHNSLVLETADGKPYMAIRMTEDTMAEVEVGGLVTKTVFQKSTDYTLLREELSIPGRDPIFEKVLPRAIALAQAFRRDGQK